MIRIEALASRLARAGLLIDPGAPAGLEITGISDDSRDVEVGDLFCAIRGHLHDGHRFLNEVAEAGAAAALVEKPEPGLDMLQLRVRDARRAAAIAAQVVYGEPAADVSLVGVTGTNGKTTTVHLARHVLSQHLPTGSLGTLGQIDTSGERRPLELTTPGPVEFAQRLADLRAAGARCVVAEVSSHALDQRRVDGVEFEIGVFTNLSRDHLDYHADFDAYRMAKWRLAELVREDGTLLLNADEPAWPSSEGGRRTIRFALTSEADYTARDVELGAWGSRWKLVAPDGQVEIELPLLGAFNIANALAAAATAVALGMGLAEVAESLGTAPPVPGRLERLADAPLVLRDYAHTPDALSRALGTLRPLVTGRVIVVFGCGGDRDRGKRPQMGEVAAAGADLAIVTSDNPRSEPPEAVIEDILPGLGKAPHEVIVDRREAIARSLELARPEDAVLLAGKGHEVVQIIGDQRRPFDEAAIVRGLLGGESETT